MVTEHLKFKKNTRQLIAEASEMLTKNREHFLHLL
jgi:hypothetical protein